MSDFVTCSTHFNIWRKGSIAKFLHLEWGVYIAALEHYRKMKYRIQLHLTLINKILRKNIDTLEWLCDV